MILNLGWMTNTQAMSCTKMHTGAGAIHHNNLGCE